MFEVISHKVQIDFMKYRRLWLGLSVVAVLATITLLFTKGLNFGIDFSGGAEIQLKVPAQWNTAMLRESLTKGGLDGFSVVQLGEAGDREFLVRAKGEDDQSVAQIAGKVENSLLQTLKKEEFEVTRSDIVGPAAGSLLRTRGFLAMLYVLLVILVYVAVRFDIRYAPGAVIALFHDAVIVLGIFIVTQKQFDLTILAAILALIGYSNNDTIIVFDRVREVMGLRPGQPIEQVVNQAINETLARTIMTALTTFLVVLALWFFGGPVLEGFSFALLCGIIVGTYSSIFIASSMVVSATHYRERKKGQSKGSSSSGRKQYSVRPDPNSAGV